MFVFDCERLIRLERKATLKVLSHKCFDQWPFKKRPLKITWNLTPDSRRIPLLGAPAFSASLFLPSKIPYIPSMLKVGGRKRWLETGVRKTRLMRGNERGEQAEATVSCAKDYYGGLRKEDKEHCRTGRKPVRLHKRKIRETGPLSTFFKK